MPDDGQEFFETVHQISTNDLNVIEIKLHADVFFPNLGNNVGCMFDMVEKIVWSVATVDRLDQQCNFLSGGKFGCLCQIIDEYAISGRTLLGRNLAGETMNGARTNCTRILERTAEQGLPILLASRYGSKAKLSVALSRWGIETKHGEFVLFNRRFYRGGRNVIGKLQLDRLEARCCGGIDPLEQGPIGEKIAKIGGKARHRLSLMI